MMQGDRWQRIEELFHAALSLDRTHRCALLEQARADDESLWREVDSLLAHADEASSFLEASASALLFPDLESNRLTSVLSPLRFSATPNHTLSIAELTGSFPLTQRFALRHCLGAGGFGVVYEVYDQEFKTTVALKALLRAGLGSQHSFRQEFRALEDIVHPNLVTLYELFADREQCFFTMELVRGLHFLHYVRGSEPAGNVTTNHNFDRLRNCFCQLAEGLNVLHRAGKIHCDLKPSNVLIDDKGRLVILDFGLITSNDPAEFGSQQRSLAGTPQYMSPEQLSGARLTEATDWYSAGVMLFEALAGKRPFGGSLHEISEQKRFSAFPGPDDLLDNLPPDLTELCRGLLSRAPGKRPTGKDVLRFLGSQQSHPKVSLPARTDIREDLIGREQELSVLDSCLSQANKQLTTVLVYGPSGVGKTTLVQHFLQKVNENNSYLVFYSRCFENEAVPYNAVDGLIECLDSHMASLLPAEAARMLPSEMTALQTLFPLIKESSWAGNAGLTTKITPDSLELRRQGIAALCAIINNIAKDKPLIIFIDDLQRGDADSAAVLSELIIRLQTASILLIGCYRSEEAQSSPVVSRLLSLKQATEQAVFNSLAIKELTETDAQKLAAALLEQEGLPSSISPKAIAREAKGHPLFIAELVHYVQSENSAGVDQGGASRSELSLDDVIRSRTLSLPANARRLLEVIAVGGQPIDSRLACRAAEIGEGGQVAMSALRATKLLRGRRSEFSNQVEIYHDRIEEVVKSNLDDSALERAHYHLAVEHERSDEPDSRAIAKHFLSGGAPLRALPHATAAAEKARAVLAFSVSSEMYQLALRAVDALPEGAERDGQELTTRQALISMLQLTRGWGAPEILETAKRAITLAEKSADLKQFASWMASRAFTAWIAADLSTARALTDESIRLNLRERSSAALPYLFVQQLMNRFWLADHVGAEESLVKGSTYFDDPRFRQNIIGSQIALFAYASWNAWMLGRADLARDRLQQLMKAVNVNNPHDLVFAAHHAALVLSYLGQPGQAAALASWALQLAKQHQFPNEAAMARGALGLARTWLGHGTDGVAMLREGIAGMVRLGQGLGTAHYTQSLALAYAQTGAVREARQTIEHALSDTFNEPVFRPEGLRLRGELRWKSGETKLAEHDLRDAIALARTNSAKAFELRAALSLARFTNSTTRSREGRQLLSSVYESFTEGFDTADLQKARAFLG